MPSEVKINNITMKNVRSILEEVTPEHALLNFIGIFDSYMLEACAILTVYPSQMFADKASSLLVHLWLQSC